MKRIIGSLALIALTVFAACNDEKKEVTKEKEVIIVPAPEQKVQVKETPQKETKVTVDKNGVTVEAKKIDVSVKK